MLAAAVAAQKALPAALEVLVVVVLGLELEMEPQAPLTRAVVEAVLQILQVAQQAAQAAPASSSSNTTSALPRSSPSSHRRSGLHQRVR